MAMAQHYAQPGGMPGQMAHGHPMGPGNPHMGPGQPGMGQMQMAMGGGPGGPQVSQAGMMGGMPQMGPGHGMTPQMAHQMQIQNAQMQGAMSNMSAQNPHLRQQLMIQQQQRMMAANQGHPGMMMNPAGQPMMMANGMHGPGVPRVNLPAHLQNQMPQPGHPQNAQAMQQQQLVLQQHQQLQAAQQASQAHQQQQQMLAMQQAGSQAGPSPAPSVTAQPPVRPPSQVQNRPDQPGGPPTSQPQPPQQQPTPVQPTQPPPQPQQPTQNQQVLQPPTSQPGPGQQQNLQQQSQPQQPPATTAPSNENATPQQRMQMQMMQKQLLLQQQQQQKMLSMSGTATLTLFQFADNLSSARIDDRGPELGYWQQFVARFYGANANLRHSLLSKDNTTKAFQVSGPNLAWFYHLLFKNGVHRVELILERAQEKQLDPLYGSHVVESPRASFVYWYGTTHQVVSTGTLKVIFDTQGKISLFEFVAEVNKEYIDRSELVPGSESPDQKAGTNSPKMSKKAQQQRSKSILGHPALFAALERRPVGAWGMPDPMIVFLEMSETFANMKQLFDHANQHPQLSVTDNLKQVVSNFQNNPEPNSGSQHGADGQPGGLGVQGFPSGPPNQRTPGAGQSFASPAPNAHLNLPGSMTASPAMMNHGLPGQGGVPMTANPSQGGSGNPSATASPNVQAGKKRRASQVKTEDDGNDKKGSPRMPNGPMGNAKRMKS